MNNCGCVPIKFYLQKQAADQTLVSLVRFPCFLTEGSSKQNGRV